ncbi:MAG TPA: hypothetical protein VKD90_23505 [Gemmataceae bacterium]|nr:hypothetical protein [Gemmataceae bacterium]
MQCIICEADNPDGKKFCGECGAPLDAVMAQVKTYVDTDVEKKIDKALNDRVKSYLDADVDKKIATALDNRIRGQTAVEIETTQNIAKRLVDWAKMAAWVIGIPIGLLVIALGILGVKSVSDVMKHADAAEKKIAATEKAIAAKEQDVAKQAEGFRKRAEELTAEMARVQAQVEQLRKGQEENRTELKRIGEKVLRYEPSTALTPALQRELDTQIEGYHQYLGRVGFQLPRQAAIVHVDPQVDNAMYYLGENKLVLGPLFAKDPSALFREYSHHALERASLGKGFFEFEKVESGLADYFSCSYRDDPTIGKTTVALYRKASKEERGNGKDYIRTLSNTNRFDDAAATRNTHDAGETLGGALWEIRGKIGQDKADRLVLAAWIALTKTAAKRDELKEFARRLLEAAKTIDDGAHVETIRKVFETRGLRIADNGK